MNAVDRGRGWAALHVVLTAAAGAALVLTLVASFDPEEPQPQGRPIAVVEDGYASSETCRSCHPNQYASWHDSYHRTMTQVASPESIVGDFGDVTLRIGGQVYRLFREGDEFFYEFARASGERHTAKISLVTGSHHMQVYWFDSGVGRELDPVPFMWLIESQRYIPRKQAFLRPPEMTRHSDRGRWNRACINCHTTGGEPRIRDDVANSTVKEFGIACEACHGPSKAHVEANRSPFRRYVQHASETTDPTVAQPRDMTADLGSEVCGHCHGSWLFSSDEAEANWRERGYSYRAGSEPHRDRFLLQPNRRSENELVATVVEQSPAYVSGLFWPDGLSRTSGAEFNGLLESGPHVEKGLSCMSCHTLHQEPEDSRTRNEWADDQLSIDMAGDRACTQCHESLTEDISSHTHHVPGSTGSRCYNCHMPHTSYGLLKGIRAHHITSPDVAVELSTGRPNACNLCHLDQSLEWSASYLQDWYEIQPPRDLGEQERVLAAGIVWATKGDAAVRALTAWHAGWEPAREVSKDRLIPMLGLLMDDSYPAIRYIAGRSLSTADGYRDLLVDSVPRPRQRGRTDVTVARRFAERNANLEEIPRLLLAAGGRLRVQAMERLVRDRDQKTVVILE